MAYARKRGMSKTKACKLFLVARSAADYEGVQDAEDAPVIEKMAEVSQQHPRYGYRRARAVLGNKGLTAHFIEVGRRV